MNDAVERSAVYRALSNAFTYGGSQAEPFAIEGAAFNEAFDPSVSEAATPLHEGAYVEDDRSALFEELVRYYEFFGLGRGGDGVEMPDHISVELEFMHFLTHLEAQAIDCDDDVASIRRAQRDFLTRHLRRLMTGLNARFNNPHAGCAALVSTCTAFIEQEIALAED